MSTEPALSNNYVNKDDPAFLYLNLHSDEDIKYIIRRHWAGFLGTFLIVLGMGLVPFILIFSLIEIKADYEIYKNFLSIGLSGFYLFLLTFLFGNWVNFYYDIIIVTNKRMINISQEGLLARKVSELNLRQIQNVTSQQVGFLQSFLNYGLLVVETAGEGTADNPHKSGLQGYFTIQDIPDTNRIARAIIELSKAQHEEAKSKEASQP